jgi:hypothetical protein
MNALRIVGIGQELLVGERVEKRLAQRLGAIARNVGRRQERPPHRLAREHQLEDLLLLVVLGEIHDQGNLRQVGVLAQRQLRQDVDLLVVDPLLVGGDHARP